MRLLVGSTAAKHWFMDFRTPNDIDYFVSTPEESISNSRGIEYFYHPGLIEWLTSRQGSEIASPKELYTIKVSHAFWALRNGSWNKHMHDILFYQSQGLAVDEELFTILYKVWEEVHGEKKANLNASAEEFFNANVHRLYDHDSIHHSVAYGDAPLFEKILKENSEVAVDRARFDALSWEDKCRLVREEVYATALERVLIPKNYGTSPRAAYNYAMMKTITSFSKGWFPRFIVDNYSHLYKPDVNYVQVHKDNAYKLILLEDK